MTEISITVVIFRVKWRVFISGWWYLCLWLWFWLVSFVVRWLVIKALKLQWLVSCCLIYCYFWSQSIVCLSLSVLFEVMYCMSRCKLILLCSNHFRFSLLRRKSIIMGTTIPLYMYVIICCRQTHVHTWELHKVWLFEDNLSGFNLLNQNVGMVRCLSPVGRFPSVRANNILKLKYFWNSFINCWQDHRKKCKCFIEISQ